MSNREAELERAIPLVPVKGFNGGKVEDGVVGDVDPDDDYDPHKYRIVEHPTS